MPKRKPKKPAPAIKQPLSTAGLRQALSKQKKADLVKVLLELAQADAMSTGSSPPGLTWLLHQTNS